MAKFDIGYRSEAMKRTVQLTVLIPEECDATDVPLLYLLHGMHGDHTVWSRGSLVDRYARRHKIAVVMADAENSFYTNQVYGYDYFDFFANELPAVLHRWFAQLTTKPEKTYIAGLSMGGYGAMLIGLTYPERYAGLASFSGPLDIVEHTAREFSWVPIAVANWGADFRKTLPGSGYDLFALVEQIRQAGKPFPRMYVSCGTEDSRLWESDIFSERVGKLPGVELLYETGPGGHTWKFWDEYLPRALQFFLTEKE